jgi:2'-hydroxyisoflavone reductase
MRLLVIGGTVFVGRAVVEEALARGWSVTVLHRGIHGADLYAGEVERITADRREGLGLAGARSWDLVVDTCLFDPAHAHPVDAGRYVFVSSISAYRDWPARPVGPADAIWPGGDDYGALKAAAEHRLEELLPGRVVHARAGTIVGPHENIGRLPHWLHRAARGGDVLAPGPGDAPVQWIDARDLAAWALDASPGAHNAVGPPGMATWSEILEGCREVTGGHATLCWVDGAAVAERVPDAWERLPLWPSPDPALAGAYRAEAAVAVRPVAATIGDTWSWLESGGAASPWRSELAVRGLPADAEASLLAELR